MPGFALRPLLVAVSLGLLLTAGTSPLFAQQRVGVSSAVNPEATGRVTGTAPRRLVIGQDVIFNEHITTGATGQTQLLFLDESSMSVGPNSDITIDQFVYDPKSGTGKLAMSATRGLLRYVGGKLSKEDNAVTLRTASATLAVRGGAFVGQIERDGKTTAGFRYGKGLTVTGVAGGSETLIRPGFATIVLAGGVPSPPGPMPPGLLALFTQQLDGQSGGTGGASNIPTDTIVADSGISQTISGNFAQSVRQAGQNQGNTGPGPNLTPPTTVTSTVGSTANQVPACSLQDTCPPGTPPGTTTSNQTTNNQVLVTYAGRVRNTNGNGTTHGFIDESTSGDLAYSGGTLSQSGTFNASIGALGTISFPLASGTATFTGTSSTLGTITGTSYLSSDSTFFYADITPSNATTERVFIYGGTPVNSSFNTSTGARTLAFTIQPDAALGANIPFLRSQTGGNLTGGTVSPLIVATPAGSTFASSNAATKALQTSLVINGSGTSQTSALVLAVGNVLNNNGQPLLNGVVNGTYEASATSQPTRIFSPYVTPVDASGNSFYGGNSISGFVLTNGNCCAVSTEPAVETNTLTQATTTYGYSPPATPTTLPSYATGTQTTQTLSGYFGGIMTNEPAGGTGTPLPYAVTGTASVSTSASNLQMAATFTGGDPSTSGTSGINASNGLVMQFGSLNNGGTNARQAFINDQLFGAERSPSTNSTVAGVDVPINSGSTDNTGSNVFMVTQTAAPPPTSLLPSGASYCSCQYLQWGYWGGELDTPASGSLAARTDVGHINFWVAGVPTSAGDLTTLANQSAVGTYTGHAIGSVSSAGANYIAAGGFTGSYNFGTQNGTMTISNFDGHTVSASGSAPLSSGKYTFTVAQTGVSGTINGSFFGPKAAETGGNFSVHSTIGPTYLASGIFAGKQ